MLGTAPCSSGSCLGIARTQDGGASWSSVTPPPTSYSGAGGSGVSAIRFADTQDGWAYGGQLSATHDAGTTWSQISLPGLSAGSGTPAIQELEASGGYVQAVYFGSSGFLIATSPVGTDFVVGLRDHTRLRRRPCARGPAGAPRLVRLDRRERPGGGARRPLAEWLLGCVDAPLRHRGGAGDPVQPPAPRT